MNDTNIKHEANTGSVRPSSVQKKGCVVKFRVNDEEADKISRMILSENSAFENVGEFFRLLVHREWNRRKGLGAPQAKDYQTAFRTGRPV